jgi:hypothetical protein
MSPQQPPRQRPVLETRPPSAPAIQKLDPLRRRPDPVDIDPSLQTVSWMRSRKMLAVVGAAAGLLILGTYLAHRRAIAESNARKPVPVEHLDLTEVNALPDPLPAAAQAALAGTFQAPATVQSLDAGTGGELEYPVREAIEEVQPTLRWSTFAQSYNIAVLNPNGQVVARAEVNGETQWTVPVELPRGAAYTWEVAATGQVRRASFRVLADSEAGLLEGLQVNHPQSHLVLGVAALQLGLRTMAQREFEGLLQEKPHSPDAAQLMRTANGLRPR